MKIRPASDATNPLPLRRREWVAGVLGLLAGCGGGVDSGGTGTGAAPTIAIGTVSGFGSIIVNGVRFDETNAVIDDDDGQVRRREDLGLGMRATVLASAVTQANGVASAVASSVRLRSEIGGPVDSLDLANGRLVVLGQRVAVDAATVFPGGSAALRVGDVVWVYGTPDTGAGVLRATRIEPRSAPGFYKLRARVAALDLAARTLTVGTLVVSWAAAAPASPSTLLDVGQRVSLRLATTPVGGVWSALQVEADTATLADREKAELEGRVSSLVSGTSFSIDGVPVDATGASFPDGSAGLVLGARVEAEGRLQGGVLVASVVKLEDEEQGGGTIELHGSIQSLNAAQRRFTVRSVSVQWNDTTRFESSTAADLAVGREVEVRGRLGADGQTVDATTVHVER